MNNARTPKKPKRPKAEITTVPVGKSKVKKGLIPTPDIVPQESIHKAPRFKECPAAPRAAFKGLAYY
jgi:hypothetical protein